MDSHTHDQLRHWDRTIVWHAFTQMAEYEPLILDRGEGCYVFDIEGRRYLDAVAASGAMSMAIGIPASTPPSAGSSTVWPTSQTSVPRTRRRSSSPAGSSNWLPRAWGTSSSATTVPPPSKSRWKMAFQYWRQRPNPKLEKTCYVAMGEAYHGDTLVSVGGVARFHELFRPLLFETLRAPVPDAYRLPPGVAEDRLLEHSLSAPIASLPRTTPGSPRRDRAPCPGGGRDYRAPQRLPPRRPRATRRHDVLLIADEVAVGFGRTACSPANMKR